MRRFMSRKAGWNIKVKNICRLRFFMVRLLSVLVCFLCTPDITPAQDNLARVNKIKEQLMVLGKEVERCKDTECQARILPEMQRLLDEYNKITQDAASKGEDLGKSPESSGRPWSPRRYSSDREYFEANLRCEPWIDHLQRWCIEERHPEVRRVNCETASKNMCIPLKVTIRDRTKCYNYSSKCDLALEEFYYDYKISTPGVMWYSSDFSKFDLFVYHGYTEGELNPFQIEIDQAHGFSIELDHRYDCKILKKRNFTKSDITYQYGQKPFFQLSINYPNEKKHLNLRYGSGVFLSFAGYRSGILTDGYQFLSEVKNPEINYFITPEIMRRALSDKKLRHTFKFKYDQNPRSGQYYRDTTLDMDIEFGPFDCSGDKNNTARSVAFSGSCTDDGGMVVGGLGSVFVNGKPIARVGDRVFSTFDGVVEIVGQQDLKVFVEGKPVARVGDVTTTGVKIIGGSKDTFVGQ